MDGNQRTSPLAGADKAEGRDSSRRVIDTGQAAVFSVLVLVLALGAALVIRAFELSGGVGTSTLYMITPTAAALIMLLVVTREGYSKEGWKSLGLRRLGLRAWWIAIVAPLLVAVAATAIVWATPLASFAVPSDGAANYIIGFFLQLIVFTVTLSLFEELGWRGYLLSRLASLGRGRALVWVGLVWAVWHLPLMLLTPLYHSEGSRLIGIPLFVATAVALSFVFGYLRLWTDSVWPAAIAHTVHNAAWGTLGAFSVTSSPVVVNEYLIGDNGLFILLGTVLVALALRYRLRNRFQISSAQPAPDSSNLSIHAMETRGTVHVRQSGVTFAANQHGRKQSSGRPGR